MGCCMVIGIQKSLTYFVFVALASLIFGCGSSSSDPEPTPAVDASNADEDLVDDDLLDEGNVQDTDEVESGDGTISISQVTDATSFATGTAIAIEYQFNTGSSTDDYFIKLVDAPDGAYLVRDDTDSSKLYFYSSAMETGTLSFSFVVRNLTTCIIDLGTQSACESEDSLVNVKSRVIRPAIRLLDLRAIGLVELK